MFSRPVIINNYFLDCSQDLCQGRFDGRWVFDVHNELSLSMFGVRYMLCLCLWMKIEIGKIIAWHCGDIYYHTTFPKNIFLVEWAWYAHVLCMSYYSATKSFIVSRFPLQQRFAYEIISFYNWGKDVDVFDNIVNFKVLLPMLDNTP